MGFLVSRNQSTTRRKCIPPELYIQHNIYSIITCYIIIIYTEYRWLHHNRLIIKPFQNLYTIHSEKHVKYSI